MFKLYPHLVLVLYALFQGFAVHAGTVSGIVATPNGQPIAGARIQAWDQDATSSDDLMGTATSDRTGRYTVIYPDKRWDGLESGPEVRSSYPDIFIIVSVLNRGQWQVVGRSVVHKDHNPNQPLTIHFNTVRTITARVLVIYGVIIKRTGRPLVGAKVKAWDKDLGTTREFMGQATTDSHGRYSISCSALQWDKIRKDAGKNASSNLSIFITVQQSHRSKSLGASAMRKIRPAERQTNIDLRVN